MLHLRFALFALGIALGLFLSMMVFLELGRRIGVRATAKRGAEARAGVGVVDGAVYALLGLLIGFTFSGSTARFDHRRELVADEANVAGTAWQRIDLLPGDLQDSIRNGFRQYLDAVLSWYTEARGSTQMIHEPPEVTRAQNELWARSVGSTLTPRGERARMLLLPALNEFFGAVEKERAARRAHPPTVIWVMLAVTALASALFAGYSLASASSRNWMYVIGLSACISLATYVIIELEYPRLGLIRVNAIDQPLIELRESWNDSAPQARSDTSRASRGS